MALPVWALTIGIVGFSMLFGISVYRLTMSCFGTKSESPV